MNRTTEEVDIRCIYGGFCLIWVVAQYISTTKIEGITSEFKVARNLYAILNGRDNTISIGNIFRVGFKDSGIGYTCLKTIVGTEDTSHISARLLEVVYKQTTAGLTAFARNSTGNG